MPEAILVELASALIASFEGVRLTAYQDSGGIWTIGFGHTGGVTAGMTITFEKAQELLAEDQKALWAAVAGVPDLEQVALVSFGYNCGLSKLIEVRDGHATMGQFVHDHAGNVLPGLVARRRVEEALMAYSQIRSAAAIQQSVR